MESLKYITFLKLIFRNVLTMKMFQYFELTIVKSHIKQLSTKQSSLLQALLGVFLNYRRIDSSC